MDDYNYIIVTPCKNEEYSLPGVIDSIMKNTIKPKLWVIVDDGSTDSTPVILNQLKENNDFVKIIKNQKSKRDLSFHYAEIVNDAINYSITFCDDSNIPFDYIALIDADMVLNHDFFESIIGRLKSDPELGVCSGSAAYYVGDKLIYESGRSQNPIGGLRVWNKKCFIDSGGFPRSYSADSVSNVLAILAGWKIKKYDDIIGITMRPTTSTEGFWKGYKMRGISDYYRDYHPIYVIMKSFKYLIKSPFYIGVAYLYGYLFGILKVKEKIDIPEVRHYYRHKYKEFID